MQLTHITQTNDIPNGIFISNGPDFLILEAREDRKVLGLARAKTEDEILEKASRIQKHLPQLSLYKVA